MTEPIKQIYRSTDQSQIAGVCAGLGAYLNLDPIFVRIVALTVTFLTGILPGVLSYLAAWIIVPRQASTPPAASGWTGNPSAGPEASRVPPAP